MDLNPYTAPGRQSPTTTKARSVGRITVAVVFSAIRSRCSGFLAVVVALDSKGAPVHWEKVSPLSVIAMVLIATHIVDLVLAKSIRLSLLCDLAAYRSGAVLAIVICFLDRNFDWFGHFTL